MDTRERRSVILHMFGLGLIEARLHAAEASMALARERMRIRFQSGVIPVVIWAALAIFVVATLYRATRHAAPEDAEDVLVGTETDGPEFPAPLPDPAPVS
jgi:hypothetical protein